MLNAAFRIKSILNDIEVRIFSALVEAEHCVSDQIRKLNKPRCSRIEKQRNL